MSTVALGRLLMGTAVEIEANHSDASISRSALEASLERMIEVDRLMSIFRPDSEISLVNRLAAARPVTVGEQTFCVLREAEAIARRSHGAFDVTVYPLMQLWRTSRTERRLPSHRQMDAALTRVAWNDLSLGPEGRCVRFRRSGMGIDLGGVAKGYAVDAAANSLAEAGVGSGLVNAGGDLRAIGRNRDGRSWRIGLRHPLAPSRMLLSILVEDEAVATSGNYFQYFTIGGRRYGHLLNPLTGMSSDLPLSATVIAETAMRADGLATAAMLLGGEALTFIRAVAGAEGIVVNPLPQDPRSVSVQITPGLSGRVVLLDRSAGLER